MTAEIHPLHTGYKPHLVYSGEPKPKSLLPECVLEVERALKNYIWQANFEGNERDEDAGKRVLAELFEQTAHHMIRRQIDALHNRPQITPLPSSSFPCDTEPKGDDAV